MSLPTRTASAEKIGSRIDGWSEAVVDYIQELEKTIGE